MRVTGLDHIVLNSTDVRRSLAFYVDELGLEPLRVDEWEAGRAPFPSVRVDTGTIIDIFDHPRADENMNHLCLVVDDDVSAIAASGRFQIETGPDVRWGARGDGLSIYLRDPDGNLVELRNYR